MVKIRNYVALVLATATVAAIAGCTSGSAPATDATNGTDGAMQSVVAGIIPNTDAGPITMGLEAGIWEANGLDLTVEKANSSPNIISAIMAGDYQIGFGGATSVFQAAQNGVDLVIIAPASATASDPELGLNDILVLPDSGMTSAADLEGKKVGVNALGGFLQMLAQVAITDAGGDPSTVEWVELPLPDQPAALESGAIDAFVAGEPFGTVGQDQGFVTLTNPHTALSDGSVIVAVWYASRAAVEANPDYYASIVTSISESNKLAASDTEGQRAAIAKVTGLDPDVASRIRLGGEELPLTPENLQDVADAAYKFGIVPDPVDLDHLIWKP